jgi:aryl-alcohol dehydrogenase-like predicted oxidoreductase
LRAGHIDVILDQLRTAWVDCLVVVPVDDPEANARQVEVAIGWQRHGWVRSLGLWIPHVAIVERYRRENPFRFAVHPCNVTTDDAPAVFAACKRAGWETLATSPFVRGWELDRMVAAASAPGADGDDVRAVVADAMLRFSVFHAGVDRVIVAMRRPAWVARNVGSVRNGPLTATEIRRLRRLHRRAGAKPGWWRRVLRRS